ncbi:hypothetical protein ATKI12_5845 [Kitasatospora sp. Ki12]|uniref:hypothetical protein n=1 Tax=Kitasatospora xanthocidica TaxID=83382 RepID=UPI00167605C4|nr:hypothetical protein [Kitasatospora xanthocidica]GHF53238.1 hypothetical protein GCM10018790_33740 [Kitasatospora xanthocidica]
MQKTARPALVVLLAVVCSLLGASVVTAADAAGPARAAAAVTNTVTPQPGDSMGWE